jgi:hypothetical protein
MMIVDIPGVLTSDQHFTDMRTAKHFFISVIVLVCSAFVTGDDFVGQLQVNLKSYYQSTVPVKLHLFHNQPGYAPGDTIFFKAVMVTAADHRPFAERAVVEVTLRDNDRKLYAEQKTILNNGLGAGYLVIPNSVRGGVYILEAFNSWMKNHPRSYFFHKPLQISGSKQFSTSHTVSFSPEGGKLIEGVTNRIAIRGDASSAGSIFTSDGNKVTDFQLNQSGLGNAFMVPRPKVHYTYSMNGVAQGPLPIETVKGLNLIVTGIKEEKHLKVVGQKSGTLELREDTHLILWHHDRVVYKANLSFKGKDAQLVQIPKSNIPVGINGLTLFSSEGEVLAERLIYIPPSEGHELSLQLSKDTYNVRETGQIEFSLQENVPLANVGITIFQSDLFPLAVNPNNIQTYFNLCGEISEGCEENFQNVTDIDLFLITQRWEKFSWENVLKKTWLISYPVDQKLKLSGTAIFADSGEPVPDSTKLLFLTKKNLMVYETFTLHDGKFDFSLLLDFAGTDEVLCQAFFHNTKLADVKIIRFEDGMPEIRSTAVEKTETDRYHEFSNYKREVADAFMSIKDVTISEPNTWATEILNFLHGEDQSFNLNDYLMFQTMKEAIHEVIPNLKSRTGKKGDFVRMLITDENREARQDPIYVIDGVLTENTSYFLSLKPEDIASIKFINTSKKLSQIGMVENGIILIETKIPNNAKNVPSGHSVFSLSGFNEKGKFSLHQLPRQLPRIPDIRSSLFWHPEIKMTGGKPVSLSFQTPDNPGNYIVIVDGITSEGIPIHREQVFTVAFGK